MSNTNVKLLLGVPFDASYSATRWFDTYEQQIAYFSTFSVKDVPYNNFQKLSGRFSLDVRGNVQDYMHCNYLMFQNSEFDNKWFFCFILNVESLNRGVTRIYFMTDVVQTWRFNIDFKPSFIAREHESLADNWNSIPESLALGNEYETVYQTLRRPQPFYYVVYCVKKRIDDTAILDEDDPDVKYEGNYHYNLDNLDYYVVPVRYFDPSNELNDMSVNNIKIGTVEWLTTWQKSISKSEKMVNNIVSIFITEYLPISIRETNIPNTFTIKDLEYVKFEDNKYGIFVLKSSLAPNLVSEFSVGNVFDIINEPEPKLRYYPYTIIEFSDGRGNTFTYKPENLRSVLGDLKVKVLGSVYFYNWVCYSLYGYLKDNGDSTKNDLLGFGLISKDMQDLTVKDDQTASYIQSNKNSLQAQQKTWRHQRDYQTISSGVRGATSFANMMNSTKNPFSVLSGSMIDDVGAFAQSGVNMVYAQTQYEDKVREQNALLEDISNVPPSVHLQGGNTNASIGNEQLGLTVKIKRVKSFYLEKSRQFFHAFGYKSNAFKLPNLHTRTHFNYIKCSMCNIQANVYNEDILQFKQVFENGITLWHTNDIYNYDVDNKEV